MHVCFLDIDGTLVLTGGAGQTAFARTFAEDFGVGPIDGRVQFAGRSDRAIVADLFLSLGVPVTAENWLRFCRGYVARLDDALATHQGYVLPGVTAFLSQLIARGDVALGLLTGNVREGARRKLAYYGLWHHFDFGGFGDDHVERCDIAATAMAAAQRHLSRRSSSDSNGDAAMLGHVLVIGDTLHDIACGRSIGARCVAVPTGHTPAEVLRSASPDVLVDTLEDMAPILALLDQLPA